MTADQQKLIDEIRAMTSDTGTLWGLQKAHLEAVLDVIAQVERERDEIREAYREMANLNMQAAQRLHGNTALQTDVAALVAAVERVLSDKLTCMPIEVDEALQEALEKVRKGVGG